EGGGGGGGGRGGGAGGLGEVGGLGRVDDSHGQAGDLQRRGQRHRAAAGRLQHNQGGLQRHQADDQGGDAVGGMAVGAGAAVGAEGGVQAGLGHGNADEQEGG